MTESSDAEIVARVLSGRRDAFGILVKRYEGQLLAYVRHMGFGEAASYDLVQDGFIRAYRHLGRCGDPDRFEGWLFKIVSNVCRTAGRKRSRRRFEPLDTHGSTLVSDDPDPEQHTVVSVLKDQVRAALETVPTEQREALILMYLQGYSVSDIAEMTDSSPSAVKMRLKRGRDALKQELEPLFAEERS